MSSRGFAGSRSQKLTPYNSVVWEIGSYKLVLSSGKCTDVKIVAEKETMFVVGLALQSVFSLEKMMRWFDVLAEQEGSPTEIVSDFGREFSSAAYRDWGGRRGIALRHSHSTSVSRVYADLLRSGINKVKTVVYAQSIASRWKQDYNRKMGLQADEWTLDDTTNGENRQT